VQSPSNKPVAAGPRPSAQPPNQGSLNDRTYCYSIPHFFALILILFLSGCYQDYVPQDSDFYISATEARQMIMDNDGNPDFVIIDVRSESEFTENHIGNAILIPNNSPDIEKVLSNLDKNKTYLLYCLYGGRSSSMLRKMRKLDFEKVYNLDGGIIDWKDEGFEVISE